MLLFFYKVWEIERKDISLQADKTSNMTEETLVISNPSPELLKALAELRKQKLEKLEKLRKMKPEDFSRRVILS